MKTETIFSEVKHRHNNPLGSFKCARVKKSVIYVAMRKQKSPIIQTQQIAVAHMREKNSGLF